MANIQQPVDSVLYNGQSVPKEHFRVFVYGKAGDTKLCNNWNEYQAALSSGIWFDSMPAIEDKVNRKKASKKDRPTFTSGTYEVTNQGQAITGSVEDPLT